MIKKPTPEQVRRRRAAGHELRERAGMLLEDASMLDDYPVLHLTVPDIARIAEALGISADELTRAVRSLCPDRDITTEADDDLAGPADTVEGQE